MDKLNISIKDVCEKCFEIHTENKSNITQNFFFNQLLVKVCHKYDINVENNEINKINLDAFGKRFSRYWKECSRSKNVFLRKYKESSWYLGSLSLNQKVNESLDDVELSKTIRGRPRKSYTNSARSSMRRKTHDSAKELSLEEAYNILKYLLRKNGEYDKASVVESLHGNDIEVLRRLREATKPADQCKELTTAESLALYIDLDLSYRQYKILRSTFLKKNYRGLPSLEHLSEEKDACVPANITVDEVSAKFSLQSSLDHTSKRILESLSFDQKEQNWPSKMVLYSKWGCDGSSGQSEYKQKIDEGHCDSKMFMVSMVPLRLMQDTAGTSKDPKNCEEIWRNPKPSSVRYCRPIEFSYSKESSELIVEKHKLMTDEIKNLSNTVFTTQQGTEIRIRYILQFTMVDGKVAQAISGNKSSLSCTVCHATQKEFCMENSECNEVESMYELGLSPLHARLRFMAHCLNIAYDLEFQTFKENNPDFDAKTSKEKREIKKELRAKTKKEIQKKFKESTGLRIDYPKQGFGNSNDGNTARRFFEDVALTASITKIDEGLLLNFKKLLAAINCRQVIDAEKFGEFSADTLKMYNNLYGSWKKLSPTIHKVLCHGENIIKHHYFPIGELSEEAQEAKNKEYKAFRLRHTRKCDRRSQNADLIKMLMISSDPLISSLRYVPKSNTEKEVISDLEGLLK